MNILIENPILIKNSDGSTCPFKIQYTTLPISSPHQGTPAYSLIVFLKSEDGNFGKLESVHQRFDTDQDPPSTDIITGTVSLIPPTIISNPSVNYPPTHNPPFTYVTTALIIQELRTGMIQEIVEYQFNTVQVP